MKPKEVNSDLYPLLALYLSCPAGAIQNTTLLYEVVSGMETEAERQDTRKAMAYDFKKIIDRDPTRESYTPEEVKKLIDVTSISKQPTRNKQGEWAGTPAHS